MDTRFIEAHCVNIKYIEISTIVSTLAVKERISKNNMEKNEGAEDIKEKSHDEVLTMKIRCHMSKVPGD